MAEGSLGFHSVNPGFAWGRAAILGLALFAAGAQVILLAGLPLPFWLPLLLGMGVPLGWRGRVREGGAAPPLLAKMAVLLVGIVLALMVWGAVATLSREWDGFVSWEARARFFGPGAKLSDPWLGNSFVFAHSRSYPILQPLLGGFFDAALGPRWGRILLPLEFLILLRLLFEALADGTRQKTLAWIGTLSLALLPGFLSPGGGSVDSGYAELLLALCLLAAASALARRDIQLLIASTFLLPQAKPEGLPYLFLLLAILAFLPPRARPSLLLPACLGAAASLLLWLPLKARLTQSGTPFLASAALGLVLPMSFWGLGLGIQAMRARLGSQTRPWVILLGLLGLSLGLFLLGKSTLASPQQGVLTAYLRTLMDHGGRLREAPSILGHWILGLFQIRKIGILPLAFILVLLSPGLRKQVPLPLLCFGALGLLATLLAFFASPMVDLAAHMHSSLGRLLLQWTGVLSLIALWSLRKAPWLSSSPGSPQAGRAEAPEPSHPDPERQDEESSSPPRPSDL